MLTDGLTDGRTDGQMDGKSDAISHPATSRCNKKRFIWSFAQSSLKLLFNSYLNKHSEFIAQLTSNDGSLASRLIQALAEIQVIG